MIYDKQFTALLVIDTYNDFISEGGKIWDRLKGVAEANKCVPHMMQVVDVYEKALGFRHRGEAGYRIVQLHRPGRNRNTWGSSREQLCLLLAATAALALRRRSRSSTKAPTFS